MKTIHIHLDNGEVWELQANCVAHSRATYYANQDTKKVTYENDFQFHEDWLKTFNHEYEVTLNDDEELRDWLTNNMDWNEDIVDSAVLIQTKETKIDRSELFRTAKVEFV